MPQEPGRTTKRRLTADDWTAEALRVLGERGLAGIAVEPIAARLGTTKGSFYWHFANRDALIEATLARWERDHTEAIITEIAAEPDPRVRLRTLFVRAIQGVAHNRVLLVLLAAVDDPRVRAALERVTGRRVDYLTTALIESGFDETAARRRAVMAYSVFLGHAQLMHTAPKTVLDERGYLDLVMSAVLG